MEKFIYSYWIKYFLMFSTTFWLLSCSNKDGSKDSKITVLGENSSNLQAMQALKGEYEAKHPIIIEYKPNTFEDAYNKANQDFSSGSGQYDIVLQYNFSLSNFVRNNYVYNYDELANKVPKNELSFESDIFPNVWKEVGYYYKNPLKLDSEINKIGYPFAANTMLLAYNYEMFNNEQNKALFKSRYNEELTIPTTWEKYKKIAEFFTNPQKNTYGVCMQGATGGWLYYEWCQYLQGFKGKVMEKEWGWMGDETTSILVNTEEGKKATEYFLGLKPYNAGAFNNTDGNEQIKIMKEGNVAMCIIWSDYVRGLAYKDGQVDKRFRVAPVPGNKSMLAGGAFFINKKSKYPVESFKYIVSLMQKDSQIKLVKDGLCSPLKSVYDAPELMDIPYVPALKISLERGEYALEAGPDANDINNIITNYLQKVWNGQISIDEALKFIQNEIQIKRNEIFKQLKN